MKGSWSIKICEYVCKYGKYDIIQEKGFDSIYDYDDEFANELDMFTTPLDDNPYVDEFIAFKDAFQGMSGIEPMGIRGIPNIFLSGGGTEIFQGGSNPLGHHA